MRTPQDNRQDQFGRLDKELDAFEAARQRKPVANFVGGEASGGYRLAGQMLGGMLGGVGLGWLFDRLLHTNPWGLVCGLLIGTGLSIYSVVRSASSGSATQTTKLGSPPAAPDDDDDEP